MSAIAQKLLIVDPLTLLGREILLLLEREPYLVGDICYVHTADDEEHQIAELAGQPSLVAPLTSFEEIPDCTAILVASESDSQGVERLLEFMESEPTIPVVDFGRSRALWDHLAPAAGAAEAWTSHHVRVAHPSLVALRILIGSLRHLDPEGGTVAAVDPASTLGREAVQALARQAGHRLQGAVVDELIDDKVLAFNLVTCDDDDLNEEAGVLFPDLDLAVSRAIGGCFHGHVAHVGLTFRDPVDEDEVVDGLFSANRIALQDPPLSLDTTPETDQVSLTRPRISRDRRLLAVTAMVDGLRIGGALTALEILQSILESPS